MASHLFATAGQDTSTSCSAVYASHMHTLEVLVLKCGGTSLFSRSLDATEGDRGCCRSPDRCLCRKIRRVFRFLRRPQKKVCGYLNSETTPVLPGGFTVSNQKVVACQPADLLTCTQPVQMFRDRTILTRFALSNSCNWRLLVYMMNTPGL